MGIETASLSGPSQPRGVRSAVDKSLKNQASRQNDDFQEDELERFGRHCQSFYNSSLVITGDSSSSLTSLDKNYGYIMSSSNEYDHGVSRGKIVMEALDRIGAMRAVVESCHSSNPTEEVQESFDRLRKEHELTVKRHGNVLDECGLRDIHRFVDLHLGSSITNNSGCYERYIQKRDEIRRASHKSAMLQRQESLHQLLADHERESSSRNYETTNPNLDDSNQPLTQLHHVKHAMTTIKDFDNKYKQNIGSHPFLAGLHRFIHEQLHTKSKNTTVQWNFRGSVLTEACHTNNNESDTTEAYARDATKVLFSFLTWVKCSDVEGGCMEHDNLALNERNQASLLNDTEPMLSFRVNKYLSDNNLRRILSVLPDPNRLDARPTGSLEIVSYRDRINVDGHLDEAWPWWQFQLCNVL